MQRRTEPCSSSAKSVTQGEFDGTRGQPKEIAHSCIEDKRDRSFTGYQCGENKGIGGSGRTGLDRVEAPRGEEIPRHSHGAPKNTTRDAVAIFVVLSPHNENLTAAVCILHCKRKRKKLQCALTTCTLQHMHTAHAHCKMHTATLDVEINSER